LVPAALPDLDVLDTEVLKALIIAQHNDTWSINRHIGRMPLNT
jgi:hypothetical protein